VTLDALRSRRKHDCPRPGAEDARRFRLNHQNGSPCQPTAITSWGGGNFAARMCLSKRKARSNERDESQQAGPDCPGCGSNCGAIRGAGHRLCTADQSSTAPGVAVTSTVKPCKVAARPLRADTKHTQAARASRRAFVLCLCCAALSKLANNSKQPAECGGGDKICRLGLADHAMN
jgi:hypothetical protein